MKGPSPIHFSEMQRLMDSAYQRRQTLNIKAWKSDGHRVEYHGWLVHHQYWKGGYVRLVNPLNREMRLVPEIFIYEINGRKVYL
ncbi:MAG: maintenance system killer protein [Prevotellaceae bacterium]|nr:maintenance system killer protein [Prevotellaceae bacterium]